MKGRGELYRNPSQGKIAGVCAGLAEYFGWETWLVRILVVSGVLLGMGWFVVIYIAAWFILDKKNAKAGSAPIKDKVKQAVVNAASAAEKDFASESIKVKSRIWQAGEPPKQAFHDIRRKFNTLERELRQIEKYVTSPEFTVSREINNL
ncbi:MULTISPECIES: envelope stress response membrane protein PspC [Thalassotalea]|uniref:Envelope stress response membrane protein PspC n=1 Tax=Thalassotalea castellviae TaxID=3075612 RepID=A0ABU2ZYJ9_9GAMM|nr:envelope stress response membrane protein PspC [Thalassotalea sp. W431]MDT0602645.1 envelope stress response membrane protein PspC [Thalassotalea sp. W431]